MLLEIENLKLSFPSGFVAVNEISFSMKEGEILALVGESGSGKSLSALSILGLEPNTAKVTGKISFKSKDLRKENMQQIRGKQISLIPQDPMSSLNPVYTIGDQLIEALQVHNPQMTQKEMQAKCLDYLDKVGIADTSRCFDSYPHELSGGMRQRVMIAMAVLNEPDLIIADEPTTALDVTVQATILRLLKALNKSILFITHDLGVVAEIADRVLVMKNGKIIESNEIFGLFESPKEDYTKKLLSAVPKL